MPANFYTFYSEAMFQRALSLILQVILQEEEAAAWRNVAKRTLSQGRALLIAAITFVGFILIV